MNPALLVGAGCALVFVALVVLASITGVDAGSGKHGVYGGARSRSRAEQHHSEGS